MTQQSESGCNQQKNVSSSADPAQRRNKTINSFMVWTIHLYRFVHRFAVSGVYLHFEARLALRSLFVDDSLLENIVKRREAISCHSVIEQSQSQ